MTIRAVSLDFHGTLAVPHPSPGAIYAHYAQQSGIDIGAADLDQHFTAAFHGVRERATVAYGSDEGDARDFWFSVVRDSFQRTNADLPPISEPLCMQLFMAFGEGRHWRVLDGVRESLNWIAGMGLPMVVCSNFDARIHRLVADLHLGPFAEVLPSTLVGSAKPDPELLLLACSLLEVEPEELLHIGDNAHEDGGAARAAGCPWLAIDNASMPLAHIQQAIDGGRPQRTAL